MNIIYSSALGIAPLNFAVDPATRHIQAFVTWERMTLMGWIQLRLDFDSTAVRRASDCLLKVAKVNSDVTR